ncbi:Zonular occludens toxin (Zot) [Andreprevotia lacus DSM 23236]|jgi:zona occludens toxin|uniref:Zonular occludens toxin (Zot) n=1 Tax=Andreprevotia lacus DSM 23236 TaxID=1121001 RepID=A0A1W1Y183_9NEIS|nr:zonular occludens toxin domain-containing protein [Andreprevotia lacus]SMC29980.1 Zonular occludens toxin (Zot) [Andreprevotia lacus DSM 23236]
MLIFHEGLPGAGKSYEAMVKQIIPALQKGRAVFTNIRGVNHQKIAEVTAIDIELVEALIKCVSPEDTKTLLEIAENDSLVVIDEVQNHWPSKSGNMNPKEQEWVTEHRHLGIDVVLLGQDRRDVHPIWRRRIDQLFEFRKLDALGATKRYAWICSKAVKSEEFQQISKGVGKYDEKYFGTYASHREETTNTETHADDRGNIFKRSLVRVGGPLVLAAVGLAIFFLWSFFHPSRLVRNSQPLAASGV